MKKYIVVDCKNFANYNSGIAGYFKPLLKASIEYFRDYDFILTSFSVFDTNFLKGLSNWEIRIIPKKKFGIYFVDIIFYDLWTYPNALKKLDNNLLISPYYDFIIPNRFKDKAIITVHDLCYWEVGNCYSQKVKLYHKFLLYLNISKAKKIITVSNTSLKIIKKIFNKEIYEKCNIVYNTYEIHNENLKGTKKYNSKKRILYTGGFEQRKNIDMLFKVVNSLKNEFDIELIFTGNFFDNIQLKKMIEFYDLESIVILTGIVTNEKLSVFYKECDLVINISLCEGFGRSNLEAIINKKPLVCSDIEVFRELVGDYAIYCNPNSINSIKDAIIKSFQKSLVINSSIDLMRFSFVENKNRFLEIIENVLYAK